MSKKLILAAVLACALHSAGTARETAFSVDSLLSRVATANKDVIAARSSHAAAMQRVAVAKSARLPQVSTQIDLSYIGDGTVLDRDFSNSMRDKLPHFGNTLNVSLYQPVFHGGAITAGIEIAQWESELSAIGAEQQIDASGIQALAAYFNLMKMHNLRKVYEENINATQKLIDDMAERHSQGTALKNDITRYELRLSTLNFDLKSIDNSISVLNHDLVTMLSLELGTELAPMLDAMPADVETEAYWQASAAAYSRDLRAIDASRRLNEAALKMERAAKLPSVGIVVSDNLSGPVTFEIPALDKNYNFWFAGVSVKYNLSSLWTANKKERQKRLEIAHIDDQRAAMSDALSRRVNEAYTAMLQARQMLDTEEVNVRLANENYEVVETRFENDMALLTDMLDASTSKLDAETRKVNAGISLLLSYYQLKFISGTLNDLSSK